MPEFAESADGTTIAFDRVGRGPALVVVGGAFNTRLSPYPLVTLLSERFTVYSYDRRGRGDSGSAAEDTDSVAREVEDLAAVVAAAGGAAGVYGHSSGAILTLEAAMAGVPMTSIAVYEPPYSFDPQHPEPGDDFGFPAAIAAGDHDAAARAFLQITGMPSGAVAGMSAAPWWGGMITTALTLPHDMALTGDGRIPEGRLAAVGVPVLAMDGGNSPEWAARAAMGIASAVGSGTRLTVEGENHAVDQTVLAPILSEFFSS
ncbi:alpha/beta hydrolase [Glaciihabitans sp. INWT7]|uniref:alpha/beta fold hydrolase n=1 Tax=Glaciihabitans sp. INWT7 TaxID=2596912 RepID=UPI0016241354|nr:alpha/beta hydrolase [Glaciihabitans sp. INWT7]QNE47323.1 alpha/beta hydrolase [Glaciihabitans sp. INWT7]